VLGDGQVVVTLEEGRPIAIAPAILAAYELTPLQGEVLRDVLHGSDDAQIAERLGILPAAVQDDIVAIFKRIGVASRLELPKKLFFEHYFERATRGAALGPDGWFAT
jgi:DNA-binding NarL/FixJ family response regulator